MMQQPRIYYSDNHKALVWNRAARRLERVLSVPSITSVWTASRSGMTLSCSGDAIARTQCKCFSIE